MPPLIILLGYTTITSYLKSDTYFLLDTGVSVVRCIKHVGGADLWIPVSVKHETSNEQSTRTNTN